jgi:hypothetical protein
MNLSRWELEMSIMRYESASGFECHWRLRYLVKRSPEASSARHGLKSLHGSKGNIAEPLSQVLR